MISREDGQEALFPQLQIDQALFLPFIFNSYYQGWFHGLNTHEVSNEGCDIA